MKNLNWISLLLAVVYTALFFEAKNGVNNVVFYAVTLILMFVYNKALLKQISFLFFATIAFITSLALLVNGTDLANNANTLAMYCLLLRVNPTAGSMLFSFLQLAQSFITKPLFAFLKLLKGEAKLPSAKWSVTVTYLAVGIVIVLFIYLYQQANPLFEQYTALINLRWLTVERIIYTALAFFMFSNILMVRKSKHIGGIEAYIDVPHVTQSQPDLKNVNALRFLLVVMNGLLLLVNVLDLRFLYFGAPLPNGLAHKLFVHDGVRHLFFSIVLGVTVIHYCAYLQLFSLDNSKYIKKLTILWLCQNLMMVLSTAYRNQQYILEAHLTYLRILVFFWLVLSIVLLLSTYLKLKHNHSVGKQLQINLISALTLFCGSSVIDWDGLISRYNIAHTSNFAKLDKAYLLSLSPSNLKDLFLISDKPGFEVDSAYHYRNYYYKDYNKKSMLYEKTLNFLNQHAMDDWRSFNFGVQTVYKDLEEVQAAGYLDTFDLRQCSWEEFDVLRNYKRIKHIKFSNLTDSIKCAALNRMPNVMSLEISTIDSSQTKHLKNLVYVKSIYLPNISPAGLHLIQSNVPRIWFKAFE